jgi:hypothetical protein
MTTAPLTAHARTRMQQRGIRSRALDVLLDFGRVARGPGGRDIVFFDKRARKRLARTAPRLAAEGKRLVRTYAILGTDGLVVTVGHRYRRIPRD